MPIANGCVNYNTTGKCCEEKELLTSQALEHNLLFIRNRQPSEAYSSPFLVEISLVMGNNLSTSSCHSNSVYFDGNGTTPLHPAVKAVISDSLDCYGNPSTPSDQGIKAKALIDEANKVLFSTRNHIAATPSHLTFTKFLRHYAFNNTLNCTERQSTCPWNPLLHRHSGLDGQRHRGKPHRRPSQSASA